MLTCLPMLMSTGASAMILCLSALQMATTVITGQVTLSLVRGALDDLSASAKSALVYGHWLGGKLLSSYDGSLFKIQRDDDDSTQDVYDAPTLIAASSGTTGLLHTVYDQSGNGNDLAAAADR